MKKIVYLFLLFAFSFSFSPPEPKVYVCDSKSSVAYHQDRDCRGLARCKHEILYITKKEAIETYGKRACKICY